MLYSEIVINALISLTCAIICRPLKRISLNDHKMRQLEEKEIAEEGREEGSAVSSEEDESTETDSAVAQPQGASRPEFVDVPFVVYKDDLPPRGEDRKPVSWFMTKFVKRRPDAGKMHFLQAILLDWHALRSKLPPPSPNLSVAHE